MNASKRRLAPSVLGALMALLLLGGCGGSPADEESAPASKETSAPTSSADSVDACSFYSAEEAEAALGSPVGEPESSGYNPVSLDSVCTFETTEPGGLIRLRVQRVRDTAAEAARMREQMEEVDDVDGLGDDAFRAAGQLFVYAKGHHLLVGVSRFGTSVPERQQIASSVAETVISRL